MKGKERDLKGKKKVNNEAKEPASKVVWTEATKTSKVDRSGTFSTNKTVK